MNYLLDTHTLLWYSVASEKIGKTAKSIINDINSPINISIVSLWEFSIKYSIGKFPFRGGLSRLCEIVETVGFSVLPITKAYLSCMIDLPLLHRDPFDRLIVATAKVENMTILTADENIHKYDVSFAW